MLYRSASIFCCVMMTQCVGSVGGVVPEGYAEVPQANEAMVSPPGDTWAYFGGQAKLTFADGVVPESRMSYEGEALYGWVAVPEGAWWWKLEVDGEKAGEGWMVTWR